jgi:hypothetical protein
MCTLSAAYQRAGDLILGDVRQAASVQFFVPCRLIRSTMVDGAPLLPVALHVNLDKETELRKETFAA